MKRKTLASILALPAVLIVGHATCEPLRQSPQDACVDRGALSALYGILAQDAFAGDKVDQQRIYELAAFKVIAPQHYNEQSGRLECRGVITFKAPEYKGFEERSGVFTFSRDALTQANHFAYRIDPLPSDTAEKEATWSELIRPPALPSDFESIERWRVVGPVPLQVGDCTLTRVTRKSTRIQERVGSSYADIPGSGSAIIFDDGVYQVSYATVQAVESSAIDDPIKLCLIEVPSDCPRGDDRGKVYSALDLRTGYNWILPDSEHGCGGA